MTLSSEWLLLLKLRLMAMAMAMLVLLLLLSCVLPTHLEESICMRKVYFDLGVSAICITCHPRETARGGGDGDGGGGPLSVSININAPSDNFFPCGDVFAGLYAWFHWALMSPSPSASRTFCYFMHSDINDLLINITLDSAQIDGAFLLCKVMFTIMAWIGFAFRLGLDPGSAPVRVPVPVPGLVPVSFSVPLLLPDWIGFKYF